ncbi:MAG: ABC transporter permease [Rhodothermales bacterium]|nr:ABC transporter permease [Rhodothermales bacterium]
MNAQKIFIVAKNEFLQRVRSRWFIFTTLLGPIVLVGFFAVVGFASFKALEGGEKTIVFRDESGRVEQGLVESSTDRLRFVASTEPVDTLRARVLDGTYSGFLQVPEGISTGDVEASYWSIEGGVSDLRFDLRNIMREGVRSVRLSEQNVPQEVYDIIDADVRVNMIKLSEAGEDEGSSAAYAIVGGIMGFLIYMSLLIYGSVVMQGVIQEKMNRVVEIVISSVRPFQLLMGKVLGIGAMGLVQMTFWAVLIAAGTVFSGTVVSLFVNPADLQLPETATQEEILAATDFTVPDIGPEVFVWFVLFFLFGFLLYATLFAAVGSAVDQQQDAQGIMLPVMMPIIISIVFLQAVIQAPNSTLALVLSLIPFTSPIPMVVRVAMIDVPFWQVALSFLLLVGTFIGAVWVSGRIYRVGILMYGKKPSFKDLARWARYA